MSAPTLPGAAISTTATRTISTTAIRSSVTWRSVALCAAPAVVASASHVAGVLVP
jgi:hypothetical protein